MQLKVQYLKMGWSGRFKNLSTRQDTLCRSTHLVEEIVHLRLKACSVFHHVWRDLNSVVPAAEKEDDTKTACLKGKTKSVMPQKVETTRRTV